MGAVVVLAIAKVPAQIGHESGELRGLDVMKAELLKAGRVNQRRVLFCVHPVPVGARGRVLS